MDVDTSTTAKRTYRSKNGCYYFKFRFVKSGTYIAVYCDDHPSIAGRDSDPAKTHLFRSGKLCFVSGKEPRSQTRAEALAAQWAEYFLEYRRTGKAQG